MGIVVGEGGLGAYEDVQRRRSKVREIPAVTF